MKKKFKYATAKQKIRIYKKAKELLEQYSQSGIGCICKAIEQAQIELNFLSDVVTTDGICKNARWSRYTKPWSNEEDKEKGDYLELNFPEILKHKPQNKHNGGYWWKYGGGDKEFEEAITTRIEVLNQVIAELEAKL